VNLIWHIVRKDARRLWLSLAAWLGLMLVQHGLEWRLLHGVDEPAGWRRGLESLIILIFVVRVLVAYLLAAGLVLEDPAGGTTAFWMTRPISGLRMLAAKLLGGGVILVLLPWFVDVLWWAVGVESITPLQVLAWHGGFVLAGVAFASLSKSVTEFGAWTVAALMVWMPITAVLLGESGRPTRPVAAAIEAHRPALLVTGAIFLLSVTVAVVGRYQRRSINVVGGAVACAGVAAVIAGVLIFR
jgi:hypothetical protein